MKLGLRIGILALALGTAVIATPRPAAAAVSIDFVFSNIFTNEAGGDILSISSVASTDGFSLTTPFTVYTVNAGDASGTATTDFNGGTQALTGTPGNLGFTAVLTDPNGTAGTEYQFNISDENQVSATGITDPPNFNAGGGGVFTSAGFSQSAIFVDFSGNTLSGFNVNASSTADLPEPSEFLLLGSLLGGVAWRFRLRSA